MGNFTSCKIRVETVERAISPDVLKRKINELMAECNIFQNIHVFASTSQRWVELRFAAKHYPAMINDIFEPENHDIWIIGSDEGGASDGIRYYPSAISKIGKVAERAIYSLDKVSVFGDAELIGRHLHNIFGGGIEQAVRKDFDWGIEIELSGIYTSNNYFTGETGSMLLIKQIEQYPLDELSTRTEIRDSIWNLDGIDFRNNFYQEILNRPDGKNKFPYVSKITFEYKGILTHIFEWKTGIELSYWEHKAWNSFFNCVNNNFVLHQFLKEMRKG